MSAATQYQPARTIEDLRTRALEITAKIRELQEEQLDTISRYLRGLPTRRLASDARTQIRELEEQLDLLVAEYIDRRRI